MAYRAVQRQARISPLKVQPVMALIRGKSVTEALDLLRGSPKRAAYLIDKVLRSAMANAEQQGEVDVDDLMVTKAVADKGAFTLKRWRPGARGRGGPYQKKFCHLTIVVDTAES